MSEVELPGTVVETRELWSVSFRKGVDGDWSEQGMPSADAAAVLRTLDFVREKYPETENRILRTDVVVSVEDEEFLREKVEQNSANEKGAEVQSE